MWSHGRSGLGVTSPCWIRWSSAERLDVLVRASTQAGPDVPAPTGRPNPIWPGMSTSLESFPHAHRHGRWVRLHRPLLRRALGARQGAEFLHGRGSGVRLASTLSCSRRLVGVSWSCAVLSSNERPADWAGDSPRSAPLGRVHHQHVAIRDLPVIDSDCRVRSATCV